MFNLSGNGQIGGHSWPTSGVLRMLGAFDLSASRRAGGYTSAL